MVTNKKTVYKTMGFCSGGAGSNTAEIDVEDGKIVRIRPPHYDKHYTPEEMNAWTYNVDGKEFKASLKGELPPHSIAYKKRVYSSNRILYPMKRVDWDPNGERNPQNRGQSKFSRISWDEALDIIESEIRRIEKKYGLNSILIQGDGHGETKNIHGPHGCNMRLFGILGGYTMQVRQPDSWEGWFWGAMHTWGQEPVGQGIQTNLYLDVAKNTKNLLFWGCDMETTTWGWSGQQASNLCFWYTELGIKQIYICPDFNYGAAVHADKWIPVLPNTDLALQFAIAYTWIIEGTYDQNYLDTHTVGFDWLRHVALGENDDTPKTPEWAEAICGVPARIIKALARTWAKEATTIAHGNGGSFIRGAFSHEPGRMEVCLLAMQGLGKPGRNQLKFCDKYVFGRLDQMPGPRAEFIPAPRACSHQWSYKPQDAHLPKTLVQEALTGNYTAENPLRWSSFPMAGMPAAMQFMRYQYPAKDSNPIHMIWSDTPCWSTCWNGGNTYLKGLRDDRIEFIMVQHPWLENDCLFADILLPVNTKMEEEDICPDYMTGNFSMLYYEKQAIEPLGESKSDWEVVGEVAKRLGVWEEYNQGNTNMDWIKIGFDSSGVNEKISFEEFIDKQYYVVPVQAGWEDLPAGFHDFCENPENNRLSTPTGLIEIYSQRLAEKFPEDTERLPYPQYIDDSDSHHESMRHERAEIYPFLMISNHPKWRVHANMDDVSWFREIETCKVDGPDGYKYEPAWLNPIDAQRLDVKTGDVVKVYNERGWVLGGVYVTERIIPGAVYQDHGARLDLIEIGEGDRAGANNLICPTNCTSKNSPGEVTSGFLVGVEKVDVFELAGQYPEAFNRVYDPNYGISLDNWFILEDGE